MKRMMLLLLVLTATGCIELPIRPESDAGFMKAPKTSDAKTPITAGAKTPASTFVKDAPAVQPEQVNDGNAPQVLDSLREELDHAGERRAEPKP